MASVEKTTEQIEKIVTEDIEVFTLTLSEEEATELRAVLGYVDGGYTDISEPNTPTRQAVSGIWGALKNAGVPRSNDPYAYGRTPYLKDDL